MQRLRLLLLLTFIESFATILLERGVYFFAHERLGFSTVQNLLFALGIGVCYVIGALSSHRLAVRFGEKRVLMTVMAAHVLIHLSLALTAAWAPALVMLNLLLTLVTGMKWPIIESYVSAGRDARATARAVGLFSIAWSSAVPLSMAVSGQLIALDSLPGLAALPPGASLFITAACINVFTILLIMPLERHPLHVPHDHPDRPPASELKRYTVLMRSSRWSMFTSYALLFLLAPLMPDIFQNRLGFGVEAATVLASLIEVFRVVAFAGLFLWAGWHGRTGILVAVALGLPVGFLMVLFGQTLGVVLAGELLFGLIAGAAYYAAIYYAMVVANASVESGGDHEGFIGLGFAVGPVMGLAGYGLHHLGMAPIPAMLVGVIPLSAAFVAAAMLPMRQLRQHDDDPPH